MNYGTDAPEAGFSYPDSMLVVEMELIGLTRKTGT